MRPKGLITKILALAFLIGLGIGFAFFIKEVGQSVSPVFAVAMICIPFTAAGFVIGMIHQSYRMYNQYVRAQEVEKAMNKYPE